MSENTASVEMDPESERPTLIPGTRLVSRWPAARPPHDTSEVDGAWTEDVPRISLIARKGRFGRDDSAASRTESAAESAAVRPVEYDVHEDERVLLILVDLPGVDPESLSIELSSAALHVSGFVPEDPRRQCPLQPGRVEGAIEVPRGTEEDSVDASLRDGLLRIRIEKPESAARTVDIAH
jgi:HSP20 family molecular chaperone IbpA